MQPSPLERSPKFRNYEELLSLLTKNEQEKEEIRLFVKKIGSEEKKEPSKKLTGRVKKLP